MIAIFPKIIGAVERRDVEVLSVMVRSNYLLSEAKRPKVNLYELINKIGIELSEGEHKAVGSLGAKDENGRFRVGILCNREHSPEKSIILGMLLGYYLFAMQPKIAKNEYKGEGFSIASFDQMISDYENDRLDEFMRLAVEFSLALHMPKGMFIQAQSQLEHLGELAGFFASPLKAVSVRLVMLRATQDRPADAAMLRKKLTLPDIRSKVEDPITAEQQQLISRLAQQNGYKKVQTPDKVENVVKSEQQPQDPTETVAKMTQNPQQALKMLRKLAKTFDESVEI